MEKMAIEKIEDAIYQWKEKKRPFYKYILVDLDDVTIIIDRLGMKIKKMIQEAKPAIRTNVTLYAFCTKVSDNIRDNCKKQNFKFFSKPQKSELFEVLKHMADESEEENPIQEHLMKLSIE